MKRILAISGALERIVGLPPGRFDQVLRKFNHIVESEHFDKTVRGRSRQHQGRRGLKGGLNDVESMLCFTLFYYRWYPMQSALGEIFGMTQQWVSLWIRHLTPLVSEALGHSLTLPDRKPLRLELLLEHEPDAVHLSDKPLRPVKRRRSASIKQALEAAGL